MSQSIPEYTQPRDSEPRTLDHLQASLFGAIEQLEHADVTPNSMTFETQRIPFGRYGEGSLATSLTLDEGYFSGTLSFMANNPEHRSFLFGRDIADSTWWTRDRTKYATDEAILRTLDANWPQSLIDNDAVRRAMDMDAPTIDTVFELIHGHLEPYAKYRKEERIYAYSHVTVDEEEQICKAGSLLLGSETDHDGFRTLSAQIELPYRCNGVDTPIFCRVTIDELDELAISSYYEHPETKKRVEVPIHDMSALVEEFETMLGKLVAEKLDR